MLVISFYTPTYKDDALRLIESCRRFDLPYVVKVVYDRDGWVQNCAYKGPFVLGLLKGLREPVLWVDADGEILRHLGELEEACKGKDFGVFAEFTEGRNEGRHMRSGTVYFAPTPRGIALCEDWAERCEKDPMSWDQQHLQTAFRRSAPRPSTHWMGVDYCRIFDKEEGSGEPYIIHYQASRRERCRA